MVIIPVIIGGTPPTITVTVSAHLSGVTLDINTAYTFSVHKRAETSPTFTKTVGSGIVLNNPTSGIITITIGNTDFTEEGDYTGRLLVTPDGESPIYAEVDIYFKVKPLGSRVDFVRDVYLTPLIYDFQNIRLYDDVGYPTNDGLIRFSFDNWVADEWHEIVKDGIALTETTDYTVNFEAGTITPVSWAASLDNQVSARYSFQYFSEAELNAFLEMSMQNINNRPPRTTTTIDSANDAWLDIIVLGAYVRCLRRILLDPTLWRHRPLFAAPEQLGAVQAILASVETDFRNAVQGLKKGFVSPRVIRSRSQTYRSYSRGYNWTYVIPTIGTNVYVV